jgi:hypothetical protein
MRDDQPNHPGYCNLCARLLQGRCTMLNRAPYDEDKQLCRDAGWRDVPRYSTAPQRHTPGTGSYAEAIATNGGLTR